MILIGLGGNLDSPVHGPPRATIEAVLAAIETLGIRIVARSGWYRTAPVPRSSQPWFVNLAIRVETALTAEALLEALQAIEHEFGRIRSERNAARIVDIDILDYKGRISADPVLTLPHPRMHERAFVLEPLRDVVPGWRHPESGLTAGQMLALLPPGQIVEKDAPASSRGCDKG